MGRIFFKKGEQRPSIFITLALVMALFAVFFMLLAGPAYTNGLYGTAVNSAPDLALRLKLVAISIASALLGLFLLVIGYIHGRMSIRARLSWRFGLGLLLVSAILLPMGKLAYDGKKAPILHDVTTNLATPLAFSVINERVYNSSLSRDLLGGRQDPDYNTRHVRHYADLKPLISRLHRTASLETAVKAAQQLGWTIESISPANSTIEAFDIVPFFGFRDNIIVRISRRGGKSYIDVRSVSAVGTSDLGVNAKRIRRFMDTYISLDKSAVRTQ